MILFHVSIARIGWNDLTKITGDSTCSYVCVRMVFCQRPFWTFRLSPLALPSGPAWSFHLHILAFIGDLIRRLIYTLALLLVNLLGCLLSLNIIGELLHNFFSVHFFGHLIMYLIYRFINGNCLTADYHDFNALHSRAHGLILYIACVCYVFGYFNVCQMS